MAASEQADRVGRARVTLAVLAACAAYVLLVAYVPGFASRSPLFCLLHRGLGLHCPTCGLTRAFACVARLEPAAAMRFHPVVPLAAPFMGYLLVDAAVRSTGAAGLRIAVPPWATRWGWLVAVGVFAVVFAVRLVTWLAPASNPLGWCIPPATFPP